MQQMTASPRISLETEPARRLPALDGIRGVRGFSPAKLTPPIGSEFAALVPYIVVMLVASFLVAWLSWHLYEKRFLALKRYFTCES